MRFAALTAACAAAFVVAARAQDPAAVPPADTAAQIEELQRALGVRDQVIRNLIGRIEQLERAVNELGNRRLDPAAAVETAPVVAEGPAAAASSAPGEAEPAAVAAVVDDQLIRAAFERTLIQRGGLLLPPRTFELAPSVSYAHSSSENIVIDGFTIFPVLVVGDIFSQRVRRDTFMTALTARVGLPWKSQLEVRLPWVYAKANSLRADGSAVSVRDSGRGDIELALSRDLPRLFGRGPQLFGSLRWKGSSAQDPFGLDEEEDIPFGSGFRTISASLTGVSVLDPVVFFGSLTYTASHAALKGEDRIDPGDSYGLQLGMALALNLETSLNLAVDQTYADQTRLNGQEVPGTYVNTGALSIGVSRSFPTGRSFDTSLAIGLSEDSPDLQLAFAVPLRK